MKRRFHLQNLRVKQKKCLHSNKLFKTQNCEDGFVIIPRNVKLAESPSFGKPVILYDIKSSGSQAYQNLAHSIMG